MRQSDFGWSYHLLKIDVRVRSAGAIEGPRFRAARVTGQFEKSPCVNIMGTGRFKNPMCVMILVLQNK